MGFFNQKRQIDTVSLISIVISTAILSFFTSWLYFSAKVDKMRSSSEMKSELLKDQIETLQKSNSELQKKIDNVREAMGTGVNIIPEPAKE